MSEISAVERQEGERIGAALLLDHVARKHEDWFAKFMWCLVACGYKEKVKNILSEEAAAASKNWYDSDCSQICLNEKTFLEWYTTEISLLNFMRINNHLHH